MALTVRGRVEGREWSAVVEGRGSVTNGELFDRRGRGELMEGGSVGGSVGGKGRFLEGQRKILLDFNTELRRKDFFLSDIDHGQPKKKKNKKRPTKMSVPKLKSIGVIKWERGEFGRMEEGSVGGVRVVGG